MAQGRATIKHRVKLTDDERLMLERKILDRLMQRKPAVHHPRVQIAAQSFAPSPLHPCFKFNNGAAAGR